MQFTQDKAHLGRVVDEVVRNPDVGIVERQKFPPVVLLGRDALADLLTKDLPLTARMTGSGDEVVSIWLDRCDPYGRDEDLPAAVEDLLGELEDYVEAWQEELQHAPSHADPGAVAAARDADPAVVDHRRVST